jgi:hypothetical protein
MGRAQRRRQSERQGIALLAALALMALIALLVVGAQSTSSLAQRQSRLAYASVLLTSAADYGLNTVLADPAGYGLAELPLAQARTWAVPFPAEPPVHVDVAATRLRGGLVWLVASASVPGLDSAQRRFNLVVRFPALGGAPLAAIVSRGGVSIGRDVTLSVDLAAEADCASPPVADLVVAPGAVVGGAGAAIVRVAEQTLAADSASYYLTGGQVAALEHAGNVRHVRGDTVIGGGAFDGILIVDGTLTIAGPFIASGVIVARGRIDARAGGLVMDGSLMSFAPAAAGTSAIDLASATVRYSACAVARSLRMAGPLRPVRQRSWAELF